MNNITITRKELYDLVWSMPMIKLTKKYLISHSDFKKVCVKMAIPLPKTGHWTRISMGKSVEITKLSTDYSGEKEVTLTIREEGDHSTKGLPSPIIALEQQIEKEQKSLLIVTDRLTNPDKLIIAAKESLNSKKPYSFGSDSGTVSCSSELNIRVAPENIGRALRFMDSFIKLVRARGHKIAVENNSVCVIVYEVKMNIHVREKMKRTVITTKNNWTESEYHPSGVLCFQMRERSYSCNEWADGKLPIEKQLAKILANLETKAKEVNAEDLRIKEYWAEQEKKERVLKEIVKRKEKELDDFKNLLKEARRWREVTLLRNYVADVEAKAIANDTLSEELKNWLTWARKKLDWYDPDTETEDELLMDVDKYSLTFKKRSIYD